MSPSELRRFVRRRPLSVATLIALASIGVLVLQNRHFPAQIDDAYIVFRYAKNLVHGRGFVFNVGERVEGVTTLLWTLLIAAGIRVGFQAPEVAHVLALASGAATLWLTYLYASLSLGRDERWPAAAAPWLVLATPAFAIWCVSGLETPLFAALVTATLYADARDRPNAAFLLAAVTTLVRPEGAILAGVVAGVRFARCPLERRSVARRLALYVLFLVVLTAFRIAYFGQPLPNTFYAKVGGVTWWLGPRYLSTFILQIACPLLLPALFAIRERRFTTGIVWSIVVMVYATLVGGDAFLHSRFFVPTLPVLASLAVRGSVNARKRRGRVARVAEAGVPTAAVWFVFGTLWGVVTWLFLALVATLIPTRRTTSENEPGSGGDTAPPEAGSVLLRQAPAAFMRWVPLGVAVFLGVWFFATEAPLLQTGFAATTEASRAKMISLLASRSEETNLEQEQLKRLLTFTSRVVKTLAERPPRRKVLACISVGILGYETNARVVDIVGLLDRNVSNARRHRHGELLVPGHQRSNAPYVLAQEPDYILIPRPDPDETKSFPIPATLDLWASPEFQIRYAWDAQVLAYRRLR